MSLFKLLMSLILSISLVSCASTTMIRVVNSNNEIDNKVKVYVNGEYKGMGNALHSDIKIIGASSQVRLKKKNCRTQTHTISKTGSVNIGAIIVGLFILFPYLWAVGYEPQHIFEFECNRRRR